jgi:hypothetical protein
MARKVIRNRNVNIQEHREKSANNTLRNNKDMIFKLGYLFI